MSTMRFCVALLIYCIVCTQWSHAQVTIWYEEMAGNPDLSSNAWTGVKPASVYNWASCPPTYCWFYQSSAGSYQLSASTTLYSAVQLTYSLEATELSGSESCFIQYSVDGTNFNSIVTVNRDSGYTEAFDQTYNAWSDAAGVNSLTIKFGSSKVGATCAFNRFTLSGTLITSEPSTHPTNHPSLSPSIPTNHPTTITTSPTAATLHPTTSPSAAPSFSPSISPTDVTLHPTLQPSATPSTYAPTLAPTCGGSQRCYAADLQPVHKSYQYASIYATGSGWNMAGIDYIFLFTIIGDSPCMYPRLTVLWKRAGTRISVYLNGKSDYIGGCYESYSSCGVYYYCMNAESFAPANIYYPGTQFSFTLDHNNNNQCLKDGSYFYLSVKVELKCWSETPSPTRSPTDPTTAPTGAPTTPTTLPTIAPSLVPTQPSTDPTNAPTNPPTMAPSSAPTFSPSQAPSNTPTSWTETPTNAPSAAPSIAPTQTPTIGTLVPSTGMPSLQPTPQPTDRYFCADGNGFKRYCYDYDIAPVFGTVVSQTVALEEWPSMRSDIQYWVEFNIVGNDTCLNATLDFEYEATDSVGGSYRYFRVFTEQQLSAFIWQKVDVTRIYGGTAKCGEFINYLSDYVPDDISQYEVGDVITMVVWREWAYGMEPSPCNMSFNARMTLYCDDRPPTPHPTAEPTVITVAPTITPTNTTAEPVAVPTLPPTITPTNAPTISTTDAPTLRPTNTPTTAVPTPASEAPSRLTINPTKSPTITGATRIPTKAPTSAEPTISPSKSPTTAEPTRIPSKSPTAEPTRIPSKAPTKSPTTELCARANTNPDAFCYTVDVFSASMEQSTVYNVEVHNKYGGATEIYDMYFTARNGACYAPYIDLNYSTMYDSNALTVLDTKENVMAQCQANKECGSYSECLADYNLGIGVLYEHKTYVLSVIGRYLANECNGNNTIDVKIDFVCDVIPPPSVSPTGHPITPTITTIATSSLDSSRSTHRLSTYTNKDGELSGADSIMTTTNIVIVVISGLIVFGFMVVCVCKCKNVKREYELEENIQSEDDAKDVPDNLMTELQKVLQSADEEQAVVASTNDEAGGETHAC